MGWDEHQRCGGDSRCATLFPPPGAAFPRSRSSRAEAQQPLRVGTAGSLTLISTNLHLYESLLHAAAQPTCSGRDRCRRHGCSILRHSGILGDIQGAATTGGRGTDRCLVDFQQVTILFSSELFPVLICWCRMFPKLYCYLMLSMRPGLLHAPCCIFWNGIV